MGDGFVQCGVRVWMTTNFAAPLWCRYPLPRRRLGPVLSILGLLVIPSEGVMAGLVSDEVEVPKSQFTTESEKQTEGSLRVTVVSTEGRPIPDTLVWLEGMEMISTSTRTKADGQAQFAGLHAGRYLVKTQSVEDEVEVEAGKEANLGLIVQPEPSVETLQVVGKRSRRPELESSAEMVDVVDFKEFRSQSADITDILGRQGGVFMQRGGSVGSRTRFCLNGLCDHQITFFIDGIPSDSAGFPSSGAFGLQLIPVSFVNQLEIHRGIVPTRLGADALGGAVNILTEPGRWSGASASYQTGSFGLHTLTLEGRYVDDNTGLLLSANGMISTAANDYEVDVELVDERGRPSEGTVRRFHDGITSYGGFVEAGFIERTWAKRLSIRGYISTYDKELQHNVVMTVPYGEVKYGETTAGAIARYDVDLGEHLELQIFATYARRIIDFVDQADVVYDWNGNVVNERESARGEIDGDPTNRTFWQDIGTGRLSMVWNFRPEQQLSLVSSPYYSTRTGEERLRDTSEERDPLTADRNLFRLVTGFEHRLELFESTNSEGIDDYIIKNAFFVKSYFYSASSEDILPGSAFKRINLESHNFGLGNGLRLRMTPWLSFKLSYEYAIRLPSVDEVFGNGVLVLANLELEPERSHNTNVMAVIDTGRTLLGQASFDVNGFWRDSEGLIALLAQNRYLQYLNVYEARTLGVEGTLSWNSPGEWLSLGATMTYADVRNQSTDGVFEAFSGDRVPQRPYLTGSWDAHVRIKGLPDGDDVLEPFYTGRYVHEFFRGWESIGDPEFKDTVDSQLVHNLGLSYTLVTDIGRTTGTFEMSNITDEKVFDFFGVQRPGRALFFKLVAEI